VTHSPDTDENQPLGHDLALSVVVITRNEAHNLPRLLDAVKDLADEVVVFDSGSTDGTTEIARKAGAKVVQCPWEGWSTTKNKANALARGRWILSLDADEAPDPDCRQSILDHMEKGTKDLNGAWRIGEINRLTRYGDHWVRHSGWFPDRKLRLWPNGIAAWKGAIHEVLHFDGPVKLHALHGVVEHYSYPHRADHLAQIEKFGAVWAQSQFEAGHVAPLTLVVLKVAAQWIKTFWIKGGILDGRTGWTIARLSAWATWRKHARLRALHGGKPLKPHRILIARTDALGDLVLSLPLVAALKQKFPDSTVGLLVRPYAEAVARAARGVDVVVMWTEEDAKSPARVGKDTLEAGQWDAVVLAYPDAGVAIASKKAAIAIRCGTARRKHMFHRMTHLNWDGRKDSGGHESWHGLRLLMPLGIEAESDYRSAPCLDAPEPDEPVRTWLGQGGAGAVLLHPGSHGSAGNWPAERFVALAEELAAKGCVVGLTGTAREGEAFSSVMPTHTNIHPLFGAFNLSQLLSAQSQAAAVVASSTGPLHTAAAMGVSVIGIYGTKPPEWSRRWAPIGPSVSVVETSAYTPEGHLDIPVQSVFEAVSQVIPSLRKG